MPVNPTYPGVYVQEEASGSRSIAGVATSIAVFVAMAERGPLSKPVRIFNFADFERNFGSATEGELATQVQNFYLNGGGQAYVMRIANGAKQAEVMIESEAGANALLVSARDPGLEGNLLRVEIDYDTASPEETFNLTVFRSVLQADGSRQRQAEEKYLNLSMDPNAGNFARAIINGKSALIEVKPEVPAGPISGVSIAGTVLSAAAGDVKNELGQLVKGEARSLTIKIGSYPAIPCSLTAADDVATLSELIGPAGRWTTEINNALASNSINAAVEVNIPAKELSTGGTGEHRLLQITSTDGLVQITPGVGGDCTMALGLGTGQGGIEGSTYGDARPAPSGFVARMGTSADRFEAFRKFAGTTRDQITTIEINDDSAKGPHNISLSFSDGADPNFKISTKKQFRNVYTVLDAIAKAISENTSQCWSAKRHGLRLALRPSYGSDDTGLAATLNTSPTDQLGKTFSANTAAYKVGQTSPTDVISPFQSLNIKGKNGETPNQGDYQKAYDELGKQVDLFNLLVLPRNRNQSNAARTPLWGPASVFCQQQRALLLVDPDDDWQDDTEATAGVKQRRIGVATTNAACYWPRLNMGNNTYVDPTGAIAGLMARIDGNRGVWKAPAGLEATIRGIQGVQHPISDQQNGVINPEALNAIRQFPSGVVCWGARTMEGFNGSSNEDHRYIPVRRTMLFIEESLYRGLRFAVFEPNDEPLWSQIRLVAGSFMNGLFRQGAFAGAKATDAYFVRCDSTTTTPNDVNLGIVNVIVGFAPLKPAEFVILTVKQIAGQVQI